LILKRRLRDGSARLSNSVFAIARHFTLFNNDQMPRGAATSALDNRAGAGA
jgi:stress response protein SCP2